MKKPKDHNNGLNPEQVRHIKQVDDVIKTLTKLQTHFKDYKLGDVFIEEMWDQWNPKDVKVAKNHMNLPIKYKVVHVSDQGVPYFRQLNSNGRPTGDIHTVPHKITFMLQAAQQQMLNSHNITSRLVPDPDILDSILLQEEFQPMAAHKEKLELFNEINKHNKKITIKTGYNDYNKIADFFKGLNPGDKFWTGPGKAFVLQKLEKVGKEWQITAVDQNHDTHTFNFSAFTCRRLYSAEPRSFSKESKA